MFKQSRYSKLDVPQKRANYFYCVRVTNPEIHDSILTALEWIVDKEAQYEDFCYSKEILQVTLCEVCLETEDDITKARMALLGVSDLLGQNLPKAKLQIKGLTTLNDKVLVADVQYGEDFRHFADLLTSKIKDAGVNVIQDNDYRAHMTVMRVTSSKARKAKVEKINPWIYVNLKKTHFGDQMVNSVHLCKMGSERRDYDGFYETPAEIIFRTEE
ncbi:unnamed protein product [Lymnaea stagnalis]|uniref:A-kinase anchor protein 7-like phosphoesterase domain-containing protein n=1 Tax=Lymnaea stagnalis TaxID=6523 RepID=A0AAV2I8N4_LYMST